MKTYLIPMAACLILVGTQSCKIMYTPNMQNVPLLKEKNEVRATVGNSDAQVAYSVTENVGIMMNAQYKKPTWTVTTGTREYKYESRKFLIEIGGGYSKKISENWLFESYGGAGYGSLNYDRSYADTSGGSSTVFNTYGASTTRFFLQPSIGVTNDNVDFAFSMRYVGMKFGNVDTTGYKQDQLIEEDLANLNKPFYSFLEPALTLRAGSKWVKFHMQAIYSMKLNQDRLNYIPFVLNFGVHFNIAPRYKKS